MASSVISRPSPIIDSGLFTSTNDNNIQIPVSDVSGGQTTNLTIPFSKTFNEPPFVMAVFQPNNRDFGGQIFVSCVHNVTKTQFEVRVGNISGSTFDVKNPAGVKWIAVGF